MTMPVCVIKEVNSEVSVNPRNLFTLTQKIKIPPAESPSTESIYLPAHNFTTSKIFQSVIFK